MNAPINHTANATNNMYRCSPRQTREYIVDILEAGCVPMIQGSPGIGKSALMHSVAREFRLKLIDHRVSTSAPEDFSGLPEFSTTPEGIRTAQFTPFTEILPIEGMSVPDDYEGWLLFLDEANSGTKMVQAALYKTLLDHMTGQKKLHPKLLKAAAGNLSTDRAIVNQMGTAMQSRMIWIEMIHNFVEWFEDVALIQHYDERIQAFLAYDESNLMDFKPDHQDKTFCCPRTWEFMNRLIKGKEVTEAKTGLYAGTITSGVAAQFVAFCALQKELVTIQDVLADPENATIPHENQKKWIIVMHLASKVNDKNFTDLCKYANRLDLAMRIQFFRSAMILHPNLNNHPAFAMAMSQLSKYLKPQK